MNRMESLIVGVFVFYSMAALFGYGKAAYADTQILIVATDYPPYEFQNPDGDLRGFDVEVTEEAFRRTGFVAKYEFYPWNRCLSMVEEGKAAAVLTTARNAKREKTMIFSDPISSMTDILLVHKDYNGPDLANLKSLGKLKLLPGVLKGSFTEKSLIEYGVPHDVSPTEEIVIKKLIDKRIDVKPALLEHILYYMKKNGLNDQFKWFIMEDVQTSDFHLAFSKRWPEVEKIVTKFNRTLAEMRRDGTYDAIHKRYR